MIMHQKNLRGKNLITLIMKNENMGICQQIVVLIEAMIHSWNISEFQTCILKHQGSNERSLAVLSLFEKFDLERIGVRKSSYFRLYLGIVVGALAILIPLLIDIGADIGLLVTYGSHLGFNP